jgi:hypothetical protein
LEVVIMPIDERVTSVASNGLVGGMLMGLGAAVAVSAAVVVLAPSVRPMARTALKLGILGAEKAREIGAELVEALDDAAAEVREEIRVSRAAQRDPATGPE